MAGRRSLGRLAQMFLKEYTIYFPKSSIYFRFSIAWELIDNQPAGRL